MLTLTQKKPQFNFPDDIWLTIFSFLQPWLADTNHIFKRPLTQTEKFFLKELYQNISTLRRTSKHFNSLIKTRFSEPDIWAFWMAHLTILSVPVNVQSLADFGISNIEENQDDQIRSKKSELENRLTTINNGQRDRRVYSSIPLVASTIASLIFGVFGLCGLILAGVETYQTNNPRHSGFFIGGGLIILLCVLQCFFIGLSLFHCTRLMPHDNLLIPIANQNELLLRLQKNYPNQNFKNFINFLVELGQTNPSEFNKALENNIVTLLQSLGYSDELIENTLPIIFDSLKNYLQKLYEKPNSKKLTDTQEKQPLLISKNINSLFYYEMKEENDLSVIIEELQDFKSNYSK